MAKTSFAAQNAWKARNYDRVTIMVKKCEKETLSTAAAAAGVSMSRFIIDSINARSPGLLSVLDDESKKRKLAGE